MAKNKIMVVVGTRPEIIRLAETIKKIDQYFDLVLVHTGQNYDHNLNQIFFEELELKSPNYYLDSPGETLGKTVGNIIAKTYDVMVQERPDALLILGDTNSCLSAYSAKRLKIPIFHMEAGNRCFDFNTPEEINRRVVDHLSDINLAYSDNAKQYLISEGKTKDEVFVTGSPMTEVIRKYTPKIDESDILEKLNLENDKYFVVSLHREENLDIGDNFKTVCNTLNVVAEKYKIPIIFSTHPRTQKRIRAEAIQFNPLIINMPAMGFLDYNKLQKNAYCVLSDSGTICEEGTIQHFPAVSVRMAQERPEGLDAGTLILGGIEKDSMLSAIDIAVGTDYNTDEIMVPNYQDTNVSDKVLRIIQSYMPIVNSRTWHK
ncbi:UDP-N-acetylglucosamine 2-epimerase (non-hydrolyzing) [Candidatus Saccharibacteria bacterium]|mgnify:FL=1|nr:UDP-N-acetylglucosamine 2-epimerase (non-hydrolyzing) [Candidatus Saccharibacteria bacterium]